MASFFIPNFHHKFQEGLFAAQLGSMREWVYNVHVLSILMYI